MTHGVHLYCILSRPRQKQRLSLGTGVGDPPAPVQVVNHRALAAVVSDSPYSAAGDDVAPTRERVRSMRRDLLAHSQVLNRLLPRTTLLPVRFGVILPDEASVVDEVLEPQHDLLVAQLQRIDGAVEVSLKVNYAEETVLRQVVRENSHLAARTAAPDGGGHRSTLADRVELGRDIAAAIQARRDRDRRWLLARLQPLTIDIRESSTSELMVLNAALLAAEDRLDRFDEALNTAAHEAGEGMRFNCVGPLPPYSFVDLRLGVPAD
jgi:hypothetical protein